MQKRRQRARGSFTHRRHKQPGPAGPGAAQLGRPRLPPATQTLGDRLTPRDHATLLWQNDYVPIYADYLTDSSSLTAVIADLMGSPIEDCTPDGLLLEYDRAKLLRLSARVADISRDRSVRNIPFFTLARSLSQMMQKTPVRLWAQERRLRSVVSHQYCRKVLELAVELRPLPGYTLNEWIDFVFCDQTFIQRGNSTRGRQPPVEHLRAPKPC